MAMYAAGKRTLRPVKAAAIATMLLALAPAQARADHDGTHEWTGGGADDNFATADNWSPVGVPGVDDTVVFDLDQSYTVLFDNTRQGDRVIVRDGEVTLDLITGTRIFQQMGGHSVVVGEQAGDDATLIVRRGRLISNGGYLGQASGSEGHVILTDGGRWESTSTTWNMHLNHGSLTVEQGGGFRTAHVHMAADVTLRDSGSSWVSLRNVNLSNGSTLLVSDGATFSVQSQGFLPPPYFANVNGGSTIEVTGTDAAIELVNAGVRVNDGTLKINDGGNVTGGEVSIGYFATTTGHAHVTNTLWEPSIEINIGVWGTGSLLVDGGATVDGSALTIARLADSAGEVTISGPSTVYDSGVVRVGRLGTGTLTIEHGATLNSSGGQVGSGEVGQGDAFVTGSGSTWNVTTGTLAIGAIGLTDVGVGTVVVDDNANLTTPRVRIAPGIDAEGTLRVDNAQWTAADDITVGGGGNALLELVNGAVASTPETVVALWDWADATVIVDNATWANTGQFLVGDEGDATVEIRGGANVSNTNATLAAQSTATADVTVAGGATTWDNDGALIVGNAGNATLAIDAGAHVSSTAGHIAVGEDVQAAVTVTGPGSRWDNSEPLLVGLFGQAELHIADGAVVTSAGEEVLVFSQGDDGGATASNFSLPGSGLLGVEPDASALVTVTGAGSRWDNETELIVGRHGPASMTIADGAVVTSGADPYDAFSEEAGYIAMGTSTADMTITGPGSAWHNDGWLVVAGGDDATLTLADGAQLTNTSARLGQEVGTSAEVTLSGDDTLWHSSDSLYVGGGENDTGDVAPFVQLLVGGPSAAVPEPASLTTLALATLALLRRRRPHPWT